jgi:serine/threonine protein kinase/acetolactate synthase regulatory subunit
MKYSRKYKKRHNIVSRRRKTRHIGGSIPVINNSEEIDTLIAKINSESSLELLQQLEKFADVMTVKQTNHLKQKNLVMEQHNNIKRNIAILDTLLEKHNNLDEITENYSTFPICKIDTTLNTMKYNHIENYITYDGYMYTFKAKGGFGKVYINNDTGINQAIKIITNTHSKDLASLVNNEIITYNNISSIVCSDKGKDYFCKFKKAYIDFVSDPIQIYVLMEYCGTDFHTIINDDTIQNKLSFSILIGLFITITKGIKCMHDNGYVHLDIKPKNITIYDVNDGDISNIKAKLIDFGISQKIADIKGLIYFEGTPEYTSPEMINKNVSDYKKCDIYSLGITFANILIIKYFKMFLEENISTKNCLKVLKLIGLEEMLSFESDRLDINTLITILDKLESSTYDFTLDNLTIDKEDKKNKGKAKLHTAEFSLMDIYNYYPNSKPDTFKYFKSINITMDDYKKNNFKIRDLSAHNVFTEKELKEGSIYYTIDDFMAEGYLLQELKDFGFKITDFADRFTPRELVDNGGFKIVDLRSAKVPLSKFKKEGFSVEELKNDGKFTAGEFVKLFNDTYTNRENKFNLLELMGKGGFSILDLNNAGISLLEFKKEEFSVEKLKNDGKFTLQDFIDLFNNTAISKYYKFTLLELTGEGGFSILDLKNAGVPLSKFNDEEFTLRKLKDGGFTIDELKNNEIGLFNFIYEEFKVDELKRDFTLQEFINFVWDNILGFKFKNLVEPNCFSIQELIDADKRVTLHELLGENGGFSIADLRKAGVSLSEFKKEGFLVEELKTKQPLDGNFSLLDFINLFRSEFKDKYSLKELIDKDCFTVNELRLNVYIEPLEPREFKNDGFSISELINKEVFTLLELKGKFTIDELKKDGFTVEQLFKDGGFTVEELFKDGGYKFSEIETIYKEYKQDLKNKEELKKLEELFKKCKSWGGLGSINRDCTYKTESKTGGRYSNKKSRRIIRNKQ